MNFAVAVRVARRLKLRIKTSLSRQERVINDKEEFFYWLFKTFVKSGKTHYIQFFGNRIISLFTSLKETCKPAFVTFL